MLCRKVKNKEIAISGITKIMFGSDTNPKLSTMGISQIVLTYTDCQLTGVYIEHSGIIFSYDKHFTQPRLNKTYDGPEPGDFIKKRAYVLELCTNQKYWPILREHIGRDSLLFSKNFDEMKKIIKFVTDIIDLDGSIEGIPIIVRMVHGYTEILDSELSLTVGGSV